MQLIMDNDFNSDPKNERYCPSTEIDVVGFTPRPRLSSGSSMSSLPSPDGQNSNGMVEMQQHYSSNGKAYYCQRCVNHGIFRRRKGHKIDCKYKACNCENCSMVEKRRQLNNKLNPRKLNTGCSSTAEMKRSQQSGVHKKERVPMCSRCSAHGQEAKLKGHKKQICPFRDCSCENCKMVEDRRKLMAAQIKLRRKQQPERDRQQRVDNTGSDIDGDDGKGSNASGTPSSSNPMSNYESYASFGAPQFTPPQIPYGAMPAMTIPSIKAGPSFQHPSPPLICPNNMEVFHQLLQQHQHLINPLHFGQSSMNVNTNTTPSTEHLLQIIQLLANNAQSQQKIAAPSIQQFYQSPQIATQSLFNQQIRMNGHEIPPTFSPEYLIDALSTLNLNFSLTGTDSMKGELGDVLPRPTAKRPPQQSPVTNVLKPMSDEQLLLARLTQLVQLVQTHQLPR